MNPCPCHEPLVPGHRCWATEAARMKELERVAEAARAVVGHVGRENGSGDLRLDSLVESLDYWLSALPAGEDVHRDVKPENTPPDAPLEFRAAPGSFELESTPPAARPVCARCNDTHRVPAPEDSGCDWWMCTSCPTPCQECRAGGIGAFCAQTPCACACHAKAQPPAASEGPTPEEVRADIIATGQAEAELGRPPITHVALRFRGKVWSLPRPYRHHNIIRMIVWLDPDVDSVDAHGDDQGFLDASGRYLTRKQAEISAWLNKQIKNDKIIGGVLTSEDLW